MIYMCPSWFGTGLHKNHILYFNPEDREWKLGPYEKKFEEFVRYFADLYAGGLLDPSVFISSESNVRTNFQKELIFLAPYRGLTGPFFPFTGNEYGSVDAEGNWDGFGKWISNLRIPAASDGGGQWIDARLYTGVGDGWLVYNQSSYAAEALAFLDFFYSR